MSSTENTWWDGVLARIKEKQKNVEEVSLQRSLARFKESLKTFDSSPGATTLKVPPEISARLRTALDSRVFAYEPRLTGNALYEAQRECANFAGCIECREMHRLEKETGVPAWLLRGFFARLRNLDSEVIT